MRSRRCLGGTARKASGLHHSSPLGQFSVSLASAGKPRVSAVPAQAGIHPEARSMFFVYLLSSKPHGTLYVGSTSDLVRRVWEHKVKAVTGFTTKYNVNRLVWFGRYVTLETAMLRERWIKGWRRNWKIQLIEKTIRLGSIVIPSCRANIGYCFERHDWSRLSPGRR